MDISIVIPLPLLIDTSIYALVTNHKVSQKMKKLMAVITLRGRKMAKGEVELLFMAKLPTDKEGVAKVEASFL